MSNSISEKIVSVVGLGQMGMKVAEMFIQKDYKVTVWNRTKEKAKQLTASKTAKDVEEAIAHSPVTIICLYHNKAVMDVLKSIRDSKVFAGKIIINFTTGSPEEVNQLESWVASLHGTYLNGAIQVAPEQMGLPHTTILMGGNGKAFTACAETLSVLGGNIKFLGEHASTSPAMDMATLAWVYGSCIGLFYGVAFCQKEGINLADYSTIVGDIAPGFLEFYKHEIEMIRLGNYNITQSPLSISVGASQRMADAVKAMGLDSAFTDVIAGLLREAKDNGYEQEEVAALVKVITKQRYN